MKKVVYVVSGEDDRQSALLKILLDNGKKVCLDVSNCGINSKICKILPPNKVATVSDAEGLGQGDLLVVGRADRQLKTASEENGLKLLELLDNADFVELNANLTAEAAVQKVLEDTKESIVSKSVLIVGCGRIGKRLAVLLSAFGARVSLLTSRKDVNAIYGETFGYGDVDAARYDIVLNTAPNRRLGKKFLCATKNGAVFYELASKPYGFDTDAAKILGKEIRILSALPAKLKPVAAAKIMYDCLEELV